MLNPFDAHCQLGEVVLDLVRSAQNRDHLALYRDRILECWLQPAQKAMSLAALTRLSQLAPDWDIADNLAVLLKTKARHIAVIPQLSEDVWSGLNAFGNSPPLVFCRGNYRYCYDRLSARLSLFHSAVLSACQQNNAYILWISPGDGLCMLGALDAIGEGTGCHVYCVDPPPRLSYEGGLFWENLAHYRGNATLEFPDAVSPTSIYESCQGKLTLAYLCVRSLLMPGFRQLATCVWEAMRPSGVMIVDDYLLHTNPVNALLYRRSTKQAVDGFLGTVDGQYSVITDEYWKVVVKR